jgi:hypothetical protein
MLHNENIVKVLRAKIPQDVLNVLGDSYISGGTIVGAFHAEDWGTDIDIYEPVNDTDPDYLSPLDLFFRSSRLFDRVIDTKQLKYTEYDPELRITQVTSYFTKCMCSCACKPNECGHGGRTTRTGGTCGDCGGQITEYQLVKVMKIKTAEKFIDFMETVFDFDICKNYAKYSPTEDKFDIYLKDYIGLQLKTTRLQFGLRPCDTIKRAEKYRKRGFRVLGDPAELLEWSPIAVLHGNGTKHMDKSTYAECFKFTDLPPILVKRDGDSMIALSKSTIAMHNERGVGTHETFFEGRFFIGSKQCTECPYQINTPHMHYHSNLENVTAANKQCMLRTYEYILIIV